MMSIFETRRDVTEVTREKKRDGIEHVPALVPKGGRERMQRRG